MTRMSFHVQALATLLVLAVLTGCPWSPPRLEVSPQTISFGSARSSTTLVVRNAGSGYVSWTVQEVSRPAATAPWATTDVPWLSHDAAAGINATEREIDHVTLTVTRAGQAVDTYNAGIWFYSPAGDVVVPVSMTVASTLVVTPETVALAPTATSADFTIQNTGDEAASWRVLFLDDPEHPENARDLPNDVLVSPNPGSTLAGQSTGVTVTWESGRNDFYLWIESDAGSSSVALLFGAALEGLEVRPSPLTLYVDDTEPAAGEDPVAQTASTLRIGNATAVSRSWSIEVRATSAAGETPPISISPSSGTTPAGQLTEIAVAVADGTAVALGSGNYELIVHSNDRFLVVPIIVEVMALPIIEIAEPPEETAVASPIHLDLLDFGREDVQKDFWIVNVGPRTSRLYFNITYDGMGEQDAVIIDVSPLQGDTNGPDNDFLVGSAFVDGVPIRVSVDRSKLQEDVEIHEITVEARDISFENVIDAVEKQTLRVRVERQPLTVEGAINRSRPPYVMRFVFLLRDAAGQVIPTRTAEDLERIAFQISEDGMPLDMHETSMFLRGPEDLKVNLVLLLDYTGSMYYAGEPSIAPGGVLNEVNAAAKTFLDDLPSSYRVALMYHNDRQQPDRLIHAFTTDRTALKEALDAFSLPVPQFGVSDIHDAVVDAIGAVVAEDTEGTLPFDEADVRAVMFITDGKDNASIASVNDVTSTAHDNRVRLYPLGYSRGDTVNLADLMLMAHDTGGHLFNAGDAMYLAELLGNEKGLALEDGSAAPEQNAVFFRVANAGVSVLSWTIETDGADWIGPVVPASGNTFPGESTLVTVQVDPADVAPDSLVLGTLAVSSNNGEGTAALRMGVDAGNAINSLSVDLRDEPGRVWAELQNQLVLTYITPLQGPGEYLIQASYTQDDGTSISGSFQEDGVFWPGDIRAGQIALNTTGIIEDPSAATPEDAVRAEVFVRTDYVPRNVNRFKMRFWLDVPDDIPTAAAEALRTSAQMQVELAPEGLLVTNDPFSPTWRLLSQGDGIYNVLTSQDNTLDYGAFGNLLKITISGLSDFEAAVVPPLEPQFLLHMRVDNTIYVSPATPGHPSETKYFLYPGSQTFPERALSVGSVSDVAGPARTAVDLAFPGIDPEAEFAWDRDEDFLPDFNDPYPDHEDLPGPLVAPNPLEIAAVAGTAQLAVTNNRLDTFSWQLTLDTSEQPELAGRIAITAPGEGTPLAPGMSSAITLAVNRTGLSSGFYHAALHVETDVEGDIDTFGTEIVSITVIVITGP